MSSEESEDSDSSGTSSGDSERMFMAVDPGHGQGPSSTLGTIKVGDVKRIGKSSVTSQRSMKLHSNPKTKTKKSSCPQKAKRASVEVESGRSTPDQLPSSRGRDGRTGKKLANGGGKETKAVGLAKDSPASRPRTRGTPGKEVKSKEQSSSKTQQTPQESPDGKKTQKRKNTSESTDMTESRSVGFGSCKTKKRKTRSYRNSLIHRGKSDQSDKPEQQIDLDAEIDRVLEEKAIKNNLTATNVKSIIREVITNNMVKKMMMIALKREKKSGMSAATGGAGNGGKDGNSSCEEDELLDFEPKLTRAKIKELAENKSAPSLWPLTPMKFSSGPPPSEAHILINSHDLPDSEGEDEDFVPTERDLIHSDDENSSVASFPSDQGSPFTPRPETLSFSSVATSLRSFKKGQGSQAQNDSQTPAVADLAIFKTPPPPRRNERKADHAVGLRTRSRLPLNDTPLQDLEMLLIPPDVTLDMYDFGKADSDNEVYIEFLKEYAYATTASSVMLEGNEDDEKADPDFNVMEDCDLDDHDKEEHRADRAVKISKQEFNGLFEGLLDDFDDCHFSSGEGMEDFSTLLGQQHGEIASTSALSTAAEDKTLPVPESTNAVAEVALLATSEDILAPAVPEVAEAVVNPSVLTAKMPTSLNLGDSSEPSATEVQSPPRAEIEEQPQFSKEMRELHSHQMSQHVQLLTQSYLFNVSVQEEFFQKAANEAKLLITNLWNMSCARGNKSAFCAVNLESAVQLVANYPKKKCSGSPIKKKILEEAYFNNLSEHPSLKLPGWVLNTICGSNVFMHGTLLPTSFHVDRKQTCFTPGEDALIALSLSDLENQEEKNAKNFKEQASVISRLLLTIRTWKQVYSRIRNVKTQKYSGKTSAMINSPLQVYFSTKTNVPPPHIPRPENPTPLPPCQQPQENLPKAWQEILATLGTDQSTFTKTPSFLEELKARKLKKPLKELTILNSKKSRKSFGPKMKPSGKYALDSVERVRGGLPVSIVKPFVRNKSSPPKIKKPEVITSSFPKHFQCLSEIDKNSATIPILNFVGEPQYYIVIPSSTSDLVSTPTKLAAKVKAITNEPFINCISTKENIQVPIVVATAEVCVEGPGLAQVETPRNNIQTSSVSAEDNSSPLKQPVRGDQNQTVGSGRGTANTICKKLAKSKQKFSEVKRRQKDLSEKDYYDSRPVSESDEDEALDEDDVPTPELVNLCTTSSSSSSEEEGEIRSTDGSDNEENENESLNNTQAPPDSSNDNNDNANDVGNGQGQSEGANDLTDQSGASGSASAGGNDGEGGGGDKDRGRKKRHSGSGGKSAGKDGDEASAEDDGCNKKLKSVKAQQSTSSSSPLRTAKTTALTPGSGNGRSVSPLKKIKKSPVHTSKLGSKRASKYNTGSVQLLLEENNEESELFDPTVIKDACMDAFLLRVQQRVEAGGRNPGLYNTFVQTLCDFDSGRDTPMNLFLKVEEVLKDYPDLVKQFAGFITPEDAVATGRFIEHQQSRNELRFMEMLEKWTSNCPQLKARIMQKYATLREEENLTEERIVNVMEPFFAQNPVMMDAFKAMFSSIYRPQSNPADFEEIHLELAKPEKIEGTNEDSNVETVKLPEETSVPATHTCPCTCHCNTNSLPFSARLKHCTKCSIKFQDGKVFVHNGRIMKPLNVGYTSPELALEIQAGATCIGCLKPKPSCTTSPVAATTTTTIATPPTQPLDERETELVQSPSVASSSSMTMMVTPSDEPMEISKQWTREEDFILLTVYQAEQNITTAIKRLSQEDLSHRSSEEVEIRFAELTTMLQKMAGSGSSSLSESS